MSINLTEDDWSLRQDIICYLYLTENRTLLRPGGVIQEMAMRYNFKATKSQYETHFKRWGIRKNKKKNVWKFIAYKVTKRKREKKKSEVYIGLDMVHPNKISKEVSRYGYEAAFSHGFHVVSSPTTPEGIIVCSPWLFPGQEEYAGVDPNPQLLGQTTLDRLPFDILFAVASSLQFDDIVSLGYTCHQLNEMLGERTLCRSAVEAHFPCSKEAFLAKDQLITYNEALQRIHDRRSALTNAHPFSARIIEQGNAFTCLQGVLCILYGDTIRVLDVYSSSNGLDINLCSIVNPMPESCTASQGESKVSLLYYSDDIITVHARHYDRPNTGRIFAISTKLVPPGGKRVLKEIVLDSSYKLFARHTGSYLYYGTYTGMGNHGHHEWEIQGVSLDVEIPIEVDTHPLQLEEFFGTDIGSTIAFKIHDGYFYAVSNQGYFDVEALELDWTSFYHCIRFPLNRAIHKAMEIDRRVYRRQHKEGPIHDSWTELSLQVVERRLVIVESRREWQNGSGPALRTSYVTKPWPPVKDKFTTSSPDTSLTTGPDNSPLFDMDDQFLSLLDSGHEPCYAPSQPRGASDYHPEFPSQHYTTRSFLLARSKFRCYDYSCGSFIDLVEDDQCCDDPSIGPCLRIRVSSRSVAPHDLSSQDETTAYRYSAVKMWPPPASRCPCSKRLHEILNPPTAFRPTFNRSITGVLDEGCLVYMIGQGRPYSPGDDSTPGTIVLINFNRGLISLNATGNKLSDYKEQMVENWHPSHWQWTPGQDRICAYGGCC